MAPSSSLVPSHPLHVEPELDRHLMAVLHPRLWVVTCISNPARFKTRYALYRKFREHVLEDLNVGLITVECALNDLDFNVTDSKLETDDVVVRGIHSNGVPFVDIHVRNSTWIWLKENLWNIGSHHLPHSCQYVLFADADIRFHNPHVVHETIVALQTHKIVQPWYHCVDLGPHGEVLDVHQSFLSCVREGKEWKVQRSVDARGAVSYVSSSKSKFNLWHPGYCMAWRRSTLDKLPLLDIGALGAGDHHMMGALVGKVEQTLPGNIHPRYREAVEEWQRRALEVVGGDVGFVRGSIAHNWHGPKHKRKYVERWQILVANAFDPTHDLFKNSYGVLELRDDRPRLRDDIRRYLVQRDEDSIDNE